MFDFLFFAQEKGQIRLWACKPFTPGNKHRGRERENRYNWSTTISRNNWSINGRCIRSWTNSNSNKALSVRPVFWTTPTPHYRLDLSYLPNTTLALICHNNNLIKFLISLHICLDHCLLSPWSLIIWQDSTVFSS